MTSSSVLRNGIPNSPHRDPETLSLFPCFLTERLVLERLADMLRHVPSPTSHKERPTDLGLLAANRKNIHVQGEGPRCSARRERKVQNKLELPSTPLPPVFVF
jgi:hypothetical protein